MLLASAAAVFAVRMRPAIAAQNAENVYTTKSSPLARTPAWRLASGLMPTDSMNMPSAVRRVMSAAAPNTTAAMMTAIGMPNQKPEPSALNGGLLTVRICPSVMSIATPRPAVIRMSVAMIGWMPSTATRNPFHTPSTSEMTRATVTATATVAGLPGSGEPRMIEQATAPEIAATAPTERSMPRVAMTSVMPTAMISVGAPLRRMSIRLPNRCPSRTETVKKPGNAMRLIAKSTSSITIGQKMRLAMSRASRALIGCLLWNRWWSGRGRG